jgi:S-adenosylmethionine:tRNA ribosyltransferase-isomerase
MRVADFDYTLPEELIADAPATQRELARFLVASAPPRHRKVEDLVSEVAPGTLVVLNDTRVLRARILGTKESTGGKCEVFLVQRTNNSAPNEERWSALARASKGLRPGTRVVRDDLLIDVCGKREDGLFEVALTTRNGLSVSEARQRVGQMPLPPYIKREVQPEDSERYQTVFAREEGAVAAPTAGLHLTLSLIDQLKAHGCEVATCTLHVGLGTFQPVTVDDFNDHPMHSEYFEVDTALVQAIARARDAKAKVLAVGTTVARALESACDQTRPGHVCARAGETRLLIQPGYTFKVVDRLLTNFHLPQSTLLALVSAFAGIDHVRALYTLAIHERYRFFSYGDAMLLDRSVT